MEVFFNGGYVGNVKDASKFVKNVREKRRALTQDRISEESINVFVHLFREWYNHNDK